MGFGMFVSLRACRLRSCMLYCCCSVHAAQTCTSPAAVANIVGHMMCLCHRERRQRCVCTSACHRIMGSCSGTFLACWYLMHLTHQCSHLQTCCLGLFLVSDWCTLHYSLMLLSWPGLVEISNTCSTYHVLCSGVFTNCQIARGCSVAAGLVITSVCIISLSAESDCR